MSDWRAQFAPLPVEVENEQLREAATRAVQAFRRGRGPWLDPSYMPLAEALCDLEDILADQAALPTGQS